MALQWLGVAEPGQSRRQVFAVGCPMDTQLVRRLRIILGKEIAERLRVAAATGATVKAALIRLALEERWCDPTNTADPIQQPIGAYHLDPAEVGEVVCGG